MMQLTSALDEIRQIWPQVFAVDLARYLIGAGSVSLLIWGVFRSRLARRKIRSGVPGIGQIWREVGYSLVTVCIFASVGTIIVLGAMHGVLPVYTNVSDYGWPYLLASLALMIVAQDAYFYWVHRLMHHIPWLWRVHATHHRSYNPTPWTAYAFDPGEALIHGLFTPVFLAIVPVHVGVLFAFTAHMMLRNAIGHCGYEVFPKGWVDHPVLGLVTSVTHHDMHHPHAPRNFGLYFTWWDRWMGTEHHDYRATARLLTQETNTAGDGPEPTAVHAREVAGASAR
jgi:Delta7-sterol 5-desaturase